MIQTLETARLQLIPFSLELKKLTLTDRTKLETLLGVRVPEQWPQADYAEALPFFIEQMEKDSSHTIWDGIIIHRADKVVIGGIGFHGGPDEAGVVEIGYDIIPEYRGHGYATEMARSLIAWALQQPDIKAVTAECLDDNIGSIKVLENVGMRCVQHEGNMLRWEIRAQ